MMTVIRCLTPLSGRVSFHAAAAKYLAATYIKTLAMPSTPARQGIEEIGVLLALLLRLTLLVFRTVLSATSTVWRLTPAPVLKLSSTRVR